MIEASRLSPKIAFRRFADKQTSVLRQVRRNARFVRSILDQPLKTGAIVPSGDLLAAKMASFVPLNNDLPVLEIGPGTGAVTRALIDRGIAPERLFALEYNPDFCDHLRDVFPEVNVINGDAFELRQTLKDEFAEIPKFSAIVSSLPLLNSPRARREKVLTESLSILNGNPFIQFSYGLMPPIDAPSGVSMTKSGWIVRNIPPARVFVYRS